MADNYDDKCYECTGYGDDYELDENGNLVSVCPKCPYNPIKEVDDGRPD